MMMFRIQGLDPAPFRSLWGLSDAELAARGVVRRVVDEHPGFPDRIGLVDVPVGETVLLLNHVSQPADSPYRASHAIFVREFADARFDAVGEVPEAMRRRLLSVRGFDADGMIVDADVVEGTGLEALIERLFGDPRIVELHVHNARQGCFSGRVVRAGAPQP